MSARRIHQKLEQVRRHEWLNWLTRAAATFIAYLALIGAGHFALDWGFRPMTPLPRLILLAVFAGAVLFVLTREVLLPWRYFPSRDEVALEVERFFPDLRGRFISAYQLMRAAGGGSVQMIARLVEETVEFTGTLNFRAVSNRSARNRSLAFAGVLLLGWGSFVGLTPTGKGSFPRWLLRLANPFNAVDYPTKTQVFVEDAYKQMVVARGDDVELRARARGVIPANGSVVIRRGKQKITHPIERSGRDFAFIQKAAVESFDYKWRLGDGRSPEYRVEVVIPPQVRGIRVRYTFPPYTRRTPETAYGGNLEALPGTKATLSIQSNKPIREGEIVLEDGRKIALARQSATTYTATMEIAGRSSYRIRMVDKYGFENRDPMEYLIQPTGDEVPRVEIRNIEERKFVTAYAALPVEIQCRDDYGVTRCQLHLSVAGGSEEIIPVPLRPNRRELTLGQTLRLEERSLETGTEVLLWASAFDNRVIGGPQQGFSRKVRLEVVSPDELVRILHERMEALLPRIERIGGEAIQSKTAVQDLIRNGGASNRPTTGTEERQE